LNPTALTTGAVIGDADTHLVFSLNNSAVSATVTLPHANSAAGKQITIQASNPQNGNTISVVPTGTDGLWDSNFPPALTIITHTVGVTLVSDGGSRWIVLWAN
jgi:hypothetical protein